MIFKKIQKTIRKTIFAIFLAVAAMGMQVPWTGTLVLQVNTYGVECLKEMGLRYLED